MIEALCILAIVVALGIFLFLIWIGWAAMEQLDAFDERDE